MANVSLWGAEYSNVPAITVPQVGGGSVTFYEDGGGGGATNYVTGEFTTQSSAGVMTITLPYTGVGYPVAAMVFVKGGAYNSAVSPWYSSAQRYAVGQWTMHKSNQTTAPSFGTSGAANQGVTTWIYKNTSSTSYARSSAMNSNVFSSSNASNSGALCCRFRSRTQLTVYVNTSSYGLLPGQEYVYHVIYSE